MKLDAVTKLSKKNKIPSKKSDDDFMSGNYHVIVIFSHFRMPDSGPIVYKTYIFINNNLLPCKN